MIIYSLFILTCWVQFTRQNFQPPKPPLRCKWKADLTFLLDSSITSVYLNFQASKNLIADVVDRLILDRESGFQIGIILFDTLVRETMTFDLRVSSKESILASIRSLPFSSYSSEIAADIAIEHLLTMLQSQGRVLATPVAILITDSRLRDPFMTTQRVESARESEVEFMALGIGRRPSFTDLLTITNNKNSIFQVIGRLSRIKVFRMVNIIVRKICQYADPCKNMLDNSFVNVIDVSHPTDCNKYVVCMRLGERVIGNELTCDLGQFWDWTLHQCQPMAAVTCPLDPCITPQLKSYFEKSLCRAFFICSGGATRRLACCPLMYRYEPTRHSCVYDPNCVSKCPNISHSENYVTNSPLANSGSEILVAGTALPKFREPDVRQIGYSSTTISSGPPTEPELELEVLPASSRPSMKKHIGRPSAAESQPLSSWYMSPLHLYRSLGIAPVR